MCRKQKAFSKILSMMVIAAMILSLNVQKASATPYGGKWNQDLYFYISGVGSDFYYYTEFKRAMTSWTLVLGTTRSNIHIYETSAPWKANVTVSFEPSLGEPVGIGEPGPNKFMGYYTYGKIQLNKYKLPNYNSTERKAIFMHEIGHVLGLNHSPTKVSSIMREDERGFLKLTAPTSYDKDDIRKLYGILYN